MQTHIKRECEKLKPYIKQLQKPKGSSNTGQIINYVTQGIYILRVGDEQHIVDLKIPHIDVKPDSTVVLHSYSGRLQPRQANLLRIKHGARFQYFHIFHQTTRICGTEDIPQKIHMSITRARSHKPLNCIPHFQRDERKMFTHLMSKIGKAQKY